MNDFAIFAFGWFCGSAFIWGYFAWNRLIRSRSEWYRDRKVRGISVPEDWEEDYPE